MVFNDTTNKNGIIQDIEFWTNLGDGAVSGDSTLLKQFTSRINQAFDRLIPVLLSFNTNIRWDDTNNTDQPSGTFNLVSGQGDYTIAQDDNGLDIFTIARVQVLSSATATYYNDLEEITNDDDMAQRVMSPNTTDTGSPRYFLKRGNTVYFFPKPNYATTAGGRIFFERNYTSFVSTDTTKEAGFPKPFHGLLPLYASLDWVVVNKGDNTTLITRLEGQIATRLADLKKAIKGRYPARTIASTRPINPR